MTLRDDKNSKRVRLDFVRKSWDTDRLTRPIDLHRKWSYVTGVCIQKDQLAWQQADPKHLGNHWVFDGGIARSAIVARTQAEQDGRGVLDEFVLLCEGPDASILNYARTWGVLELCRHNLPSCHEFSLGVPLRLPVPLSARPGGMTGWFSDDPRQCPPTGLEPLATWRFFSAQARALLNIAASLQQAQAGDKEDWAKLLRDGVAPAPSLDAQRLCMRDAIEGWLKLGRIKPTIDDLTICLTWTGADLFGELAVQIALAAKAMDGQVLCVACGKAYQPKRWVIRRGYNYCGEKECQREATASRAKRYRARKGMSVEERKAEKLPFRGAFQGSTDDPLFSQ